uniref:Antigenic membrane protein n=1 Tax=Candidatus Phytoplasma japonicum TaxID=102262 RepID=B1Q3E8_9MOLU|nr:antigenic membrane protein [Candidatus Phytoplasma japonicum]
MQNVKTKKSLVSKLVALFAVATIVALLSVNSVFGAFGDAKLPSGNLYIVLKVADKDDSTKRMAAIKEVDGLKDASENDFSYAWNTENTELTLTSKEGGKFVTGTVKLTRKDSKEEVTAAVKAATPFYKKWWFWTIIVAFVAIVGGVAFYFVKKRQQA